MQYASLYEYLPEIAEKETRSIWLDEGYSDNVPSGNYGLLEYYCVDPNCDCRRVMFHVMSEREGSFIAVINFGWESQKFYEKWLCDTDKDWIAELKGPSLNTWSPQVSYARELLTVIQDIVLKDQEYVNRLKKHYEMFKHITKTQCGSLEDSRSDAKSTGKIGRNDPCTCGSGQKYKKCCGR